MNVAGLLMAAWLLPSIRIEARRATLPLAAVLQLATLWTWHTPTALVAAHHSALLSSLMHVSLLGVSVAFWAAVLSPRQTVWRSILALLATAKALCLAGVVLVFSRRPFYSGIGNPEVWGLSPLEDQQLAGLLMVSSCALIQVTAAIVLFARWLASCDASRPDGLQWNCHPDVAFMTR
jgi:putative membrane protein